MADTPTTAGWTIPSVGNGSLIPYNQTYGGVQAPYDNINAQILDTMRMSGLLPGYPKNPMSNIANADGTTTPHPNLAGRYSFGGGGGGYNGAYGLLGSSTPAAGAGGPPGMNGQFHSYTTNPGTPNPAPNPAPPNPAGSNPTMTNPGGGSQPFNSPEFTQATQGYLPPTSPAPQGAMAQFYAGRGGSTAQQASAAQGLLGMFGGDQTKMDQFINQAQFADPAAMAQADRANGLSQPASFAIPNLVKQGAGTVGPNGQFIWNPNYKPKT